MNRTTRLTLEAALERTKASVVWDRENVAQAARSLANYRRALAEDSRAVRDLEKTLREDK